VRVAVGWGSLTFFLLLAAHDSVNDCMRAFQQTRFLMGKNFDLPFI
jgi:hypothetical protein